jgi:hypothetical protein
MTDNLRPPHLKPRAPRVPPEAPEPETPEQQDVRLHWKLVRLVVTAAIVTASMGLLVGAGLWAGQPTWVVAIGVGGGIVSFFSLPGLRRRLMRSAYWYWVLWRHLP